MQGPQDGNQQAVQPDKTGWIRKFCGKGIFREIWKNRYVILKGDQLFISEKEVKDEKKIQEVVDLTDYEKSEELRKAKSRSKKNHSKFTVLRCRQPGNTIARKQHTFGLQAQTPCDLSSHPVLCNWLSVPNLVFLAVSPEEKESWITALNAAITRAKNRILDEEEDVPAAQSQDSHEDVVDTASTQCTADSQNPNADTSKLSSSSETTGKSQSLPRKSQSTFDWSENHRTPQLRKKTTASEKNRCASLDEILTHCETRALPHCSTSVPVQPISQLQDLITKKLERTQELLTEVRVQAKGKSTSVGKISSPGGQRKEAQRLLEEAASTWDQARDVLEEVKELRALYKQLDSVPSAVLCPTQNGNLNHRKSMM
ncbi:hypothetical protein DNTS_012157 [Danionella cerebrum]|uniref:PH domain-containing protein n=1 Tax=Danionella cerebrum TaxID=2873325 RepID=A0A553Q8Z4_9TELE|nr:hypothetical protein DNTS_012157 [Danionella translucida]